MQLHVRDAGLALDLSSGDRDRSFLQVTTIFLLSVLCSAEILGEYLRAIRVTYITYTRAIDKGLVMRLVFKFKIFENLNV